MLTEIEARAQVVYPWVADLLRSANRLDEGRLAVSLLEGIVDVFGENLPMALTTRRGMVEYVSPSYLLLKGLRADDCFGNHLANVIGTDDYAYVVRNIYKSCGTLTPMEGVNLSVARGQLVKLSFLHIPSADGFRSLNVCINY